MYHRRMTKPPSKRGGNRGGKNNRYAHAGLRGPGKARPRRVQAGFPTPDSLGPWAAGPRAEPRPAGGELRDPHAAREAARYEQPIASREMILQLLAAADGPMDADALAQKARTDRARSLRCPEQAPGRDGARRPAAAEPPRRLCAGRAHGPDPRRRHRQSRWFRFPAPGRGRRRRPVPAAVRDAQGDARRPRARQRHRRRSSRPSRRRRSSKCWSAASTD